MKKEIISIVYIENNSVENINSFTDINKAENMFINCLKEDNASITIEDIQDALDDGYFDYQDGNINIIYSDIEI